MNGCIVVMGLGNILYGDEGYGVRLAQNLYSAWDFPEHVEIVDGGTQGQTLLTYVERAEKLLVLDAVDFGLEPGEIVQHDKMPAYVTAQKVGPHQNSFSEVLGLATLRDKMPKEYMLLGVQPAAMTLGADLSPTVAATTVKVEGMALDILKKWGVTPIRRTEKRHLSATALDALLHPTV